MQLNDKTNEFEVVDTYNQIVQLDGRYKHYVTNVTNGLRFSIVVYKMFDRRYKEQPYFTGVKIYKLI